MNQNTTLYPDQPVGVSFHDEKIWVELADGRIIGSPIAWYPFLVEATPEQRHNVQLLPLAVEWADLDDGISIDSLLAGRKPPFTLEEYRRRMTALQDEFDKKSDSQEDYTESA